MKFLNEEHELFVKECLEKSERKDCYHASLFYVLGLSEGCRQQIDSLYDWRTRCIKPILDNEEYGWITGTDIRLIRLAYNLFNNGAPTAFAIEDLEKKNKELLNYLPTELFSYLESQLIEGCFEGIRIRYELA